MRLLLSLPLGLLIGAALGALGGGGSILAVPALVYAVGLDAKAAVTTSLLVVGIMATGGAVGQWRAGRVRVGAGLWFGAAGVAGSLVGSHLNRAVDPKALLIAFSGLMLLAAWRMWASSRARVAVPAPASVPAAGGGAAGTAELAPGRGGLSLVASVAAAGTVVGFMTGFFGVGGGFVIVPALVLALRFDMPTAVGTSLLVIAINSAVALSSRLATVGVNWRVALPFAGAGLVGAVVGTRLAHRLPASTLMRSFSVLLVAVAVYTLMRSALG